MSIENKAQEYEAQIQVKLKNRQELDDDIARLQNIHNNLAKREEMIESLRRQVKQYDISPSDLFESADTEEVKKRTRKAKDSLDLENTVGA